MSTPAAEPQTIDQPQQPAERFLLLDGLRGVAAFAVILDHVSSGIVGDLVPARALSVDFFFVLSGFVLAHAYGRRLETGWSPWAFMRARLIRLYPLYLAGTLLGIALATLQTIKGWEGGLSLPELLGIGALALVFLPQPPTSPGNLYPFNGPAWSLFFELLVNVVYALTARFLNLRVLAVVLVISAALLATSVLNHPDVRGPGWRWSHLDAGLGRVLYNFFAGVAIYKLRARMHLPAIPWWAAAALFLLIIAMPVGGDWAPAYDVLAAIVLMPVLVALASGGRVSGVVAQACAVLGLLSYGVYVTHEPLHLALQVVLAAFHVELPHSVAAPVIVAILAASAAGIANRLYDKPFRAWLTRVLPGGTKRKKASAAGREHG